MDLDLIHLLDGGADLWLVGVNVNNKNEGVVVLDFFHGRLRGERMLDGGELVKSGLARGRLGWALGVAEQILIISLGTQFRIYFFTELYR